MQIIKPNHTPPRWLWGCLLLCLAVGCDDNTSREHIASTPQTQGPAETTVTNTVPDEVTLALIKDGKTEERLDVVLHYTLKPNKEGPRAMEIFLRHSDNLQLSSNLAMEATEIADKQLVVQEQDGGTLRIILFSSNNLNTVNTGPLAKLQFVRTSPGRAEVDFVTEKLALAPMSASEGLTLSGPIVVGEP